METHIYRQWLKGNKGVRGCEMNTYTVTMTGNRGQSVTSSTAHPLSLATSFLVLVVIKPILRAIASAVRGWSPWGGGREVGNKKWIFWLAKIMDMRRIEGGDDGWIDALGSNDSVMCQDYGFEQMILNTLCIWRSRVRRVGMFSSARSDHCASHVVPVTMTTFTPAEWHSLIAWGTCKERESALGNRYYITLIRIKVIELHTRKFKSIAKKLMDGT